MAIESIYPAVQPSLDLNFAAGNFDPRITFTRASGATYYDGRTVAKAEENLLLRSQDFDATSWVKINVSSVANSATAPDGTVTADTLTFDALPVALAYQSVTVASGTYTFSVYAKTASGTKQFRLQRYGATASTATSTALVATTDWQRFTFTVTANSESTAWYLLNDAAGTAGDLIIWGAQLEQRSQVTAYTPTTTQPITNYIPVLQTAPANVPRIDHDPVTGECKGLLIEELRQNLLTYSEQFGNSSWGKVGSSIFSNVISAPDGSLTVDKLVENSASGTTHGIDQSITTTAASYTFSAYVKPAERSRFRFASAIGLAPAASFDLLAVTATPLGSTTSATITPVGNGWFRCTATRTVSAGSDVAQIQLLNNSGLEAYTGDSYSGIYIWGAQLEAGSFPTSYIKTEAPQASQATRVADSAAMTGANFSSWYRQGEGTLFANYVQGISQVNQAVFSVGNSSTGNDITLYNDSQISSGLTPTFVVTNNSDTQAFISYADSGKRDNKLVGAYSFNNFASSMNGSTTLVDVLGKVPAVDQAWIGRTLTANAINGHIRRISYYPKRLTDAQLQALTT